MRLSAIQVSWGALELISLFLDVLASCSSGTGKSILVPSTFCASWRLLSDQIPLEHIIIIVAGIVRHFGVGPMIFYPCRVNMDAISFCNATIDLDLPLMSNSRRIITIN